ncbi:phospholipase A2 A2-actitoxin-Ucs2a [Calliopsis andreniformis]|uniref:phospholipase A2 A2-actitoxin-Ucs2a n=1 Tax=Calliopsis andreniformis TaxID=337506 RepID=UPI003FCD55BC
MKTYSMNRKRIKIVLIPYVFGWPQSISWTFWRIVLILSLVILPRLPCYEGRARNTLRIQRSIEDNRVYKLNTDEPSSHYIENDWQEGNPYILQNREPWDTVSINQQKNNIYLHEPLSVNFTYNDTNSNQLLTHHEESMSRKRFKRGVIHLYNMVVCATGCNPLAYKGYGCYCGFLGSGYVIDGIDRCCKMHDWCYDATECPMFSEYFVPYYWRCYHGYKPVCAVEHGNWGGSGSCAQRLCECDRTFAECLRRYPCPTTKAVCTSSPWRLVQNLFMVM